MKNASKAATACVLVVVGMAGLYFKVEYSGWVLAAGLLIACGVSDD